MAVLTTSIRRYNSETFEEHIIKISLSNINTIINWDANREPDEQKIYEIIESIKNDMHSIQIINCFQKDKNYIIIDGGHRVEAYKRMMVNDTDKIKEYLKNSLILSVVVSAPIEYIVARFVEINKATPLPELYKSPFTKSTEELRIFVPNLIKEFKKVYKCYKTTNKPHLPNYNQGTLTDDLFDILNNKVEDINKPLTTDLIMDVFSIINTKYKNDLLVNPTKIKNGVKIINKAEAVNCYIFIYDWKTDFVCIFNRNAKDSFNLISFEE